ncbi:alpha/beta hydrolase [Streptococcus dysgalactiae]|uniref:Phospholipase/carboxylesterase n=1 Tax=Streptococcus dysgalactiae subsp. equisimilis TaxID=119602 RepID=A0A9X8T176_STREQ|nr:alpha/beta hydrolase [Streptococcus dysgalactiae]MDO5364936.1 alpha/beta hydrolase [Streptococcus dysgalactiae]SQF67875.1 phospholipase/carboxylesterase [Streptococcus dysgalactiae subsp. equisimilis]VEF05185.1 phospholipase/carboxylesterase [Streptococcus dysgalactiae subsp. equisimilis]
MTYLVKNGHPDQPTFILLHGTGGNEESLLNLANFLNPDANLISLRGEVNENEALRFFKRHREGLFDEEDLNTRGRQLKDFLEEQAKTHQFDLSDAVLIGFSNGANMAINLLLADQSSFQKVILFAPMYPVDTSKLTEDKSHLNLFISMGTEDPLVSMADSQQVLSLFESRRAKVTPFWVTGHEIRLDSLQAAKEWLEQLTSSSKEL